ncbi:alpha/beta hydrolase fold domain-containing protein [Methanobrevibacter sp.]|uniref:alpha/beta hydrolase fold domain-containing protein n=1 Tax=Methanobrevibacter sp. TaxID=66852 RepID=UPI00389062B5
MSKSFIAKIEEIILKFTKPDYMDSQEKIDDFLANKHESNKPIKNSFHSFDFNGMQVFTFGEKGAKNTIVYVHGGAYVNEINWQHYIFCLLMSRRLDAYVLAPVYPLAPHHKAAESFKAISDFYENLIQNHRNITLMGDSAGGGFVLSFCQYLKTIDLPQPDHIITFSPWVDISMSNPPYDNENDPILGEIGLKEIGKSWAGDLDVKDYRVSPIFGDSSGLAKMLIFAGENEIFYKDIKKYVEKLKRDGIDVRFITGEGLFHIYPLFPMPEAKKAFNEIKNEIR